MIVVTVSLRDHIPYGFTSSFLCIWNQMPWRNLWTVVLPWNFFRVLPRWFDEFSANEKLQIDFSENGSDFFNVWLDTTAKPGVINLWSYCSKSYASVVLRHSEVTYLEEREDTSFCPFHNCFLYIKRCIVFFKCNVALSKKYVVKFPCLPYFKGYFLGTYSFSASL